jgi:hypothetical protein
VLWPNLGEFCRKNTFQSTGYLYALIWRVSQGVIHNREAPPSPAHLLGHGGGIYHRIYSQFMLRDFAYLLTLVDYHGSGESMHLFLVVADIDGYGGDGGWQAAAGGVALAARYAHSPTFSRAI